MHFFLADGNGLTVAQMKETTSMLSTKRLEFFALPPSDLLILAK